MIIYHYIFKQNWKSVIRKKCFCQKYNRFDIVGAVFCFKIFDNICLILASYYKAT